MKEREGERKLLIFLCWLTLLMAGMGGAGPSWTSESELCPGLPRGWQGRCLLLSQVCLQEAGSELNHPELVLQCGVPVMTSSLCLCHQQCVYMRIWTQNFKKAGIGVVAIVSCWYLNMFGVTVGRSWVTVGHDWGCHTYSGLKYSHLSWVVNFMTTLARLK